MARLARSQRVVGIFIASVMVILTAPVATLKSEHRGDCCFPIGIGVQSDFSFSPLLIGIEREIFRKHNFEVKAATFADSRDVVEGMVAGKLDVGAITISTEAIQALRSAAGLRIVADGGQSRPGYAYKSKIMIAAKRVKDIRDISALKGRRIGFFFRRDSVDYFAFLRQIEQAKLKEGDINIVEIRAPQELETRLKEESVDAVVVSEPWAGFLRARKAASPLGEGVRLQVGLILYSPSILRNPSVGRHFATAYLETLRNFGGQPFTQDTAAVVERYTGFPTAALFQAGRVYYSPDGQPNIESVTNFQSWSIERRFLKEALQIKEVSDFRFLRR